MFGVGCRSRTHRSVAYRSVGADRQHFSASPPPGRPGRVSGSGPVRDLTPHHRTARARCTHAPLGFHGPTGRVDTAPGRRPPGIPAPVATDDADARRSCSSDALRASSRTPSGKTLRACATTPASENHHCICHVPAVVDQRLSSRPDPNGAGASVGTRMGHATGCPEWGHPGSNVRFHPVAVQRRVRFPHRPGRHGTA